MNTRHPVDPQVAPAERDDLIVRERQVALAQTDGRVRTDTAAAPATNSRKSEIFQDSWQTFTEDGTFTDYSLGAPYTRLTCTQPHFSICGS
jgi:hypothetical protein